MWIFITKKLSKNFPPYLSIHWSEEWIDFSRVGEQIKKFREEIIEKDTTFLVDEFGYEHNELGARGIVFNGEKYKVFPDEYSFVSPENLYIFATEESCYEFILDEQIAATFNMQEYKEFIDALLLETDNKNLLILVSVCAVSAKDETLSIFLPGWFKPTKELLCCF